MIKSKEYKKGQVDMFNRLFDAAMGVMPPTDKPTSREELVDSLRKLIRELNVIREELTS